MKKLLLTVCAILTLFTVCAAGCFGGSPEGKTVIPDTEITTEEEIPAEEAPQDGCPDGDCENEGDKVPTPRRGIKRRREGGNVPHPPRPPRPLPKPVEPYGD